MKELIKSIQGDLLKQSDLLLSVATILDKAHDEIRDLLGEGKTKTVEYKTVTKKPVEKVQREVVKKTPQSGTVVKLVFDILENYRKSMTEFTVKMVHEKVLVAFPKTPYNTVAVCVKRYETYTAGIDMTSHTVGLAKHYMIVDREETLVD